MLIEKVGKYEVLPALKLDTYGSNGNPLIAVQDICRMIGHDPTSAGNLTRFCEPDEIAKCKAFYKGETRELLFVTARGLNEILMGAKSYFTDVWRKEMFYRLTAHADRDSNGKRISILGLPLHEK